MKTLLSCEFNMDTGCVELKEYRQSVISEVVTGKVAVE